MGGVDVDSWRRGSEVMGWSGEINGNVPQKPSLPNPAGKAAPDGMVRRRELGSADERGVGSAMTEMRPLLSGCHARSAAGVSVGGPCE